MNKVVNVSTKLLLEKSAKTKKNLNKNHERVHNLWRTLGTKLVLLIDFLDHIFKTVVPKQFLLFSILHFNMSRNMCKLRHKVRNGQTLPHASSNFRNKFVLSNFTDNLDHFSTCLRPHYQKSFFLKKKSFHFYAILQEV